MKKCLFVSFFLAFAALQGLSAQDSIALFQLGGPTTKVVVMNDTSDNTPLSVSIGGKQDRELLLRGGSWGRRFGIGTIDRMSIVVYACGATGRMTSFTKLPPVWATQESWVGDLALTPDYLANNPSEPEMKKRVDRIKHAIRDELGHKQMDHELDDWLHFVEHNGLRPRGLVCENPQIVVQNVSVYQQGWQAETMTFIVRGNRKDGYKMDQVR